MLRISQNSVQLLMLTPLSRTIVKLIGEYTGMDTALNPGQIFVEHKKSGRTFLKRQDGLYFHLGVNYNILLWKIVQRTPKSYIVKYVKSMVLVDTFDGVLYKFEIQQDEWNGKSKRVFPLRRKVKYLHELLDGLLHRDNYYLFDGRANIVQEGGNFIVSTNKT